MLIPKWFRKFVSIDIDGKNQYWSIRYKWESSNGLRKLLYYKKWKKLMSRFNACLPLQADIDRSVIFPHGINGIFISKGAHIGESCVLFQQVTIGSNTLTDSKNKGAPNLKDHCYIGAGAKIIGNVTVGSGVRIGANCVISHNIPDHCTVVLQKPIIIEHQTIKDNTYHQWENDAINSL